MVVDMSATTSILPAPRLRRMAQLLTGLVMFGVSLAMLVTADLGLDPWDVFHQGLAVTFNVRLGAVVVVTSIAVLVLWWPLRQRPGIGTILNAVLVGVVFEVTIAILGDLDTTATRWAMLGAATATNAVATGLYVGAGLGPGPRDGLMTGLADRGHSISRVRTSIEVGVLILGWLLGGSVGIGTVVFALSIGPLVQLTLPAFTIASRPQLPLKETT
jgi:uncharacterized membrane protein YczE